MFTLRQVEGPRLGEDRHTVVCSHGGPSAVRLQPDAPPGSSGVLDGRVDGAVQVGQPHGYDNVASEWLQSDVD